MVVEGHLHEVDLRGKIAVGVVPQWRIVVHHTYRRTVVLLVGASAECHMVVGDESGARDGILEVGVVAAVGGVAAESFGRGEIAIPVEHVNLFVHSLEADITIV